MTENGTKRTRNTSPLTVGQAIDLCDRERYAHTVRAGNIRDKFERSLRDNEAALYERLMAIVDRVPAGPEHHRAVKLCNVQAEEEPTSDDSVALDVAAALAKEEPSNPRLDRILNEQPPPAPAAVEINRETGKSERRTAGRGAG